MPDTTESKTIPTERAMDAEIATKVFDYWDVEMYEGELVHGEHNMNGWPCKTPHYSTDIAAAWLVIEKMHPLGQHAWNRFECALTDAPTPFFYRDAAGAALAICRAAIAAVEGR